jgi:hypothetical protein
MAAMIRPRMSDHEHAPRRPARHGYAAPVLLVLAFSLMLTLAADAWILGLPAALIVGSWFFKYAFLLMDHAAHGRALPCCRRRMRTRWARRGQSCMDRLSRRSTARAARSASSSRSTRGHLAFVARIAVLMSLCLALFLLLGVLIHRRRFELGFEADHAPERRQARDDRERDRERDRFVDQLFAECRSGSTRSAWTTIEQRAGDGAQRLPELEWIYARVAARPDPRLASRVAGELVNALLAALDAGAPAP